MDHKNVIILSPKSKSEETEVQIFLEFSCDRCSHAIGLAPTRLTPRLRLHHYSPRRRSVLLVHWSVVYGDGDDVA